MQRARVWILRVDYVLEVNMRCAIQFPVLAGIVAACLAIQSAATDGSTPGSAIYRSVPQVETESSRKEDAGQQENQEQEDTAEQPPEDQQVPQEGLRVQQQEDDAYRRQREGGIPRGEVVQQQQGTDEEGTEDGMPQFRSPEVEQRSMPRVLPPDRHRWRLGVFAYNTDTGVVVSRVIPHSAAWQAGLEPGDRIVAVAGFQVGYVGEFLFPLGAELQRNAGPRGELTLLVQNVRNDELLNLPVRLEPSR
jgi:C-terminal processing protease CtpA/Prc